MMGHMVQCLENFHRLPFDFHRHVSAVRESEFHGRVVSVFDSLPETGKVMEVITRIFLIIIAPFVYLAYFFASLFRVSLTTKESETHSLRYAMTNGRERVGGVCDQAQDVILEIVRDLFLRNQFRHVKLLITSRVEDREEKHELDFASGRGVLMVDDLQEPLLREIETVKRMLENLLVRVGEQGHIRLMFKGFFQTDDNFLVKDWSLNDFYDRDHFVRIPVQGSHLFEVGRALEVLRFDFDDLQIEYPGFESLEAFFAHRVFG